MVSPRRFVLTSGICGQKCRINPIPPTVSARCPRRIKCSAYPDRSDNGCIPKTAAPPAFRVLLSASAYRKGRRENIAAFNTILADWARTCTRSDIVEAARAGKLPFGPVLKIADLIADRQMLDRSFLDLDAASPTFGVARLPAVWAGA